MKNKKNETVTLKKGKREVKLDYSDLRKALLSLRAVNSKTRQKIIDFLEENETVTITDLCTKLRLDASVVLQNLNVLMRPGMVIVKKEGGLDYYSLSREELDKTSTLVEDLTN